MTKPKPHGQASERFMRHHYGAAKPAAEDAVTSRYGNRCDATVGDFLRCIARGETLAEVGSKFGVTAAGVRKRLMSHGLPSCAADYLRWIHGGPKDGR